MNQNIFPNVILSSKEILTRKIHNSITFMWILLFLIGIIFVIGYGTFFIFNVNGVGLNIRTETSFYNLSIIYVVLKPMFIYLTMFYISLDFNGLLAKFIYTFLSFCHLGISLAYFIYIIVYLTQCNNLLTPTNPCNSLNYCCVINPNSSHCQNPSSPFFTSTPNCYAAETSKDYTSMNPMFLWSLIFVGILFLLDVIVFITEEFYMDLSLKREISDLQTALTTLEKQPFYQLEKEKRIYNISDKLIYPHFSENLFQFLNNSFVSLSKKINK